MTPSKTSKTKSPSKKKTSPSKPKTSTALAILPSGSLDQPRALPELNDTFRLIDRVIGEAVQTENAALGFDLVDKLGKMQQLGGIGSAKALWMMRANWGKLGKGRGDFFNEAYTTIGLAPDTARRYIGVWEMHMDLPKEVTPGTRKRVLERPIIDQIALSSLYREGSLTPKRLEELSQAPDTDELRKGIRRIQNKPEEGTDVRIVLNADGTLTAWQDKKSEPIGFLKASAEDMKNKLNRSAVERIIKRAGISRANFTEDDNAQSEEES